MDGFTPSFFLQLLIAVGSAGAVYGAIKTDLANLHSGLAEEKRLREEADKENDKSVHDIRDKLSGYNGRISKLEGQQEAAERS